MILVTGGAGYIGSHCVLCLLYQGYDVIIFDNLKNGHFETIEKLKTITAKGRVVDFIKGDLKNLEDIKSVFQKHNDIIAVAHFAAYIEVAESVVNPEKYYLNNVVGSLNLFSTMLASNVKKIVFSSTAAVYGEPKYTPIDEEHSQNPINPYGQTKFMVEKILDDYDKAYNLKSVRLRYFNVAGADLKSRIGEWHEPESHLIPNILKSTFADARTFEMFGDDYATKDGSCIRDYVNIEDLIEAHILALKYLENNNETIFVNLGTGTGNSVKEVFKTCEKITGKEVPILVKPKRDGDSAVLIADNKKAQKLLKWQPKRSLEDSIASALEWERALNLSKTALNVGLSKKLRKN